MCKPSDEMFDLMRRYMRLYELEYPMETDEEVEDYAAMSADDREQEGLARGMTLALHLIQKNLHTLPLEPDLRAAIAIQLNESILGGEWLKGVVHG